MQLDAGEIDLFARTGTGVAHCPCSNMRLASGIAPVRQMADAGMKVGLGVDGSASNDSGHMLNEARQTMLLQRVEQGGDAMTAREALALATRGGASVLGRDDIGMLAPGYAADIAAFDRRGIDFAGSDWDPLASLLFCGPVKANHTIINGRSVVEDGQLVTMDMGRMLEQGQCATPVPVRANRSISPASSCTQCACHTSSPVQPTASIYSPGRMPNCARL